MMKKQFSILVIESVHGKTFKVLTDLEDAENKNDIHLAKDVETATKYLKKTEGYSNVKTPNIIILDLEATKSGGVELLTHLKSDHKLNLIPVIILCSSSSDNEVYKIYNHHANCFITKPVNFEKFIETINIIKDFWINIAELPKIKDE